MKHFIELEGVCNARQLGGYIGKDGKTVKENILIRCAKLNDITDKDIQKLQSMGLKVIIDFRSSHERTTNKEPMIPNVQNVPIAILDETYFNDSEDVEDFNLIDASVDEIFNFLKNSMEMKDVYIEFFTNPIGKAGYKRFFEILLGLGKDEAILWHCSGGKDRTGCAAALLLSVLGVERDVILSDYLLTNISYGEDIAQLQEAVSMLTDDQNLIQKMIDFIGVREDSLKNALNFLDKTYGSVQNYVVQALGITEKEIETLREKFLE